MSVILLFVELFAHFILGLGSTPTYIYDKEYEYIYGPNQNVIRFGNNIITNEYSMRSLPLKENERRILIFGDSVLNGGNLTGHNKLATTLLEQKMQNLYGQEVRVLNISAGSWGPDNAFAYIKKHGNFNAHTIILVFSSHDAHDIMEHENIVGINPSYPSTNPSSAISDGFYRYVIPRLKSLTSTKKNKLNDTSEIKKFNPGWKNFISYCNLHKIKLFVVLHPEKEELLNGQYNQDGDQIIKILKSNNIHCLEELNTTIEENYRDVIHLNIQGQNNLYHELIPYVKEFIIKDKQ